MRNGSSLLASCDSRATHNLSSRPSFREGQRVTVSTSGHVLNQMDSRDADSLDLGSENSSALTGTIALNLLLYLKYYTWFTMFKKRDMMQLTSAVH